MRKSLRRMATAALTATTAAVLVAPAFASDIIWARYGDSDTLDPHASTTTLSMQSWRQIYDTLLAFDENGAPRPNMAKSYEVSDDGMTVTFSLQDGLMCHDGTPFDSTDVKYTFDRALSDDSPSITKSAWGPISSVDAPDASTIVVKFDTPFGAFVPFMADPFSSMLCDTNEALGDAFGSTAAIGTGPWKLDEWVKGDRIVLSANPDYKNFGHPVENKGKPYSDRLIIRTVPEAQTRLAGLRTGELHIVEPPLEEVAAIKEDSSMDLHIAEATGQDVFFEFTISRPPFNDERVRQAIAHGVDVDMALDIAFQGLVQREKCPIAQGVFGNDQEFCAEHLASYDPEKAKALLAEAGYGPDNPVDVTMMTWTGGGRERMLQIFQNQLAQIGVKTNIEIMDIGTLNARVKQENEKTEGKSTFDMMGWSWYDPDILYQLWHSPGAYSGYNTPELDAMLEDMRSTVDPDARLEIVKQVNAYLLEKAIHVPLYTPGWMWLYVTAQDVDGFVIGAFDQPLLMDVKITD
ncbi:ABC transporter substrate-binding protein [Oricola sp.]|uniref:ABC transporter substrate-binding protein n=1 Tax=Oricola sp. TaxID=1979950 RepID=UPI0025CE0444|nr:ABC transporter substrate-binding protein [Oricola sp.]MCI5074060.1 ABC transporter substrate-binding protein [Oricola sp.]